MSASPKTALGLIKSFLKEDLLPSFNFQDKPSQIYPLATLAPYLNMPLPLKKSDHNLLIVLKKGSINIQIDTKIHHIPGNCIVFISAGTIYALQEMDPEAGYFILVESKVLTAIINNETILSLSLIHPITPMNNRESEWFCKICSLFYEEVCRKRPNRKIGQSLLQAMLYKLLDMSGIKRALPRDQQIAVQFRHLVNDHLKDQKNVAFYADELSISANYLNRCLRSVFNKNAKDIITETLILHSKLMLLDTTIGIAQIGYELNFGDPSYFSRAFKKVTGLSPTDFKKANMHN